ncbi:thermonuclease family protein [Pseudodesulfovibrio sp. zrk46]|uniref:thermonuclease family protein n=1 Tax=Pseudodesulfovibrio sp. zrk46 TaxID=2725288 RepID=UPI001448EF8A|nr:thermonuclease family protein [Pseudodesulfovibrio sp. zrk46]QJB57163.1 thermonuclease family protein [Pseudodesulfovibrio sp. zrk46]
MLVLLCFFCPSSYAADGMVVELVRVVDGDTFVVNIAGWPDVVGREIGVRLAGCDTPELRDKRPAIKIMAYQAKEALGLLLTQAKTVELRNIRRGKYFRLVADVFADDTDVAAILIAAGLAQPYHGGRRPCW